MEREEMDLRKRAEQIVSKEDRPVSVTLKPMSFDEIQSALHDLQIHQIELEMQNEALRQAQTDLEAMRQKYFDLYEFAPLGCFNVARHGAIQESNLTSATLLGVEPSALKGKMFSDFVWPEDQDVFYLFMKRLFGSGEPQVCELRLVKGTDTVFWVQLDATLAHDPGDLTVGRVALSDITARKLAEVMDRNAEKEKRVETLLVSNTMLGKAENECALFAQRLRELLENSQGAAYKRNLNSDRYEYLSPVFAQLTGYTPDEMETMQIQKVLDLIHSDDAREVARVIDEAMSTSIGTPFSVEYRFKHKGGWEVWLRDRFVVMADLEGRPVALVGDTSDITERKRMERSLRDSEDKYRTVFSISNDAIFVIDQETLSILDANQAACDLYGYTLEEMLQRKATDMSAEQDKTAEAARRMQADSASIPLRFHKTKEGLVFPVEISACFFLLNDRMAILTSIRDISKRRLVEEEILRLSYRDGMTGLYNRRFYEEELRRLETPRNLPLSFVIADVNGLKLINDSYGHAEGDELLKRVAAAMQEECRADEILVRLGGDEFAILLPKTASAEAQILIDRLRSRIARDHNGNLDVSVSFGHGTKERMEDPFVLVFRSAEDAMYRNKLYESQSISNKTISLIMGSLLENDPREQLHSQRISAASTEMARRMDLGEQEISRIRLAGLMHDIGKIGIRESILKKAGPLTLEERLEMQHHPEIGWRILSSVHSFSEIGDIILQHHERWDGTGYPKGLKAEGILLSARIVAVADAFEAMTNERAYREVFSYARAIAELRLHSGTQFDPEVVRVFIEMLESQNTK